MLNPQSSRTESPMSKPAVSTGGRSSRQSGVDIAAYVSGWSPTNGDNWAEKVADFLHGYSKAAPYTYISKNLLAKVVMQIKKLPSNDSPEVAIIAGAVPRARKIALRDHKQSIHSDPHGSGVRMTVDDDDKVETQVHAAGKRVASAHKNLERESEAVNVSKLREETNRKFMATTVAVARKALSPSQMDQLAGLLNPKKSEKAK